MRKALSFVALASLAAALALLLGRDKASAVAGVGRGELPADGLRVAMDSTPQEARQPEASSVVVEAPVPSRPAQDQVVSPASASAEPGETAHLAEDPVRCVVFGRVTDAQGQPIAVEGDWGARVAFERDGEYGPLSRTSPEGD